MPATAYDIVVGALQRCKVYAIGEPPTAAVGQIGLRTLNMMRAQMSAEGVACFGLQELTASADGASSYTVGTGGDIAGRILGVRSVSILDGDTVTALDEVTLDEFRLLAAAESGSPIYWAQKQGEPYSVYLWPAPASGTVRIPRAPRSPTSRTFPIRSLSRTNTLRCSNACWPFVWQTSSGLTQDRPLWRPLNAPMPRCALEPIPVHLRCSTLMKCSRGRHTSTTIPRSDRWNFP